MFLLKSKPLIGTSSTETSKFHYVSIKILRHTHATLLLTNSKFHYVSIKIETDKMSKKMLVHALNSTIFTKDI